jgi:hypothetical protein
MLQDHLSAETLSALKAGDNSMIVNAIRAKCESFGCGHLDNLSDAQLQRIIDVFVHTPEACEVRPGKGAVHSTDHPHVSKKRVKGRPITHGCYRRDQKSEGKAIWLSDKMVKSIKGLT